ncbi:MAG: DinB family protein, partial [Planctomycetota bacterium]
MNHAALVDALERFGATLPVLVRDVSTGDARWRPPDGAWSILEIVTHLADEEVEDFRTRLRLTL